MADEWLNDFKEYAHRFLKVKNKAGAIVPFRMNSAQEYIHSALSKQLQETGMVRAEILKGRQMGCSTYVEGRFFHKTSTNFGIQSLILTHEQAATDNLFGMTQRYYENLPDQLKPELSASNAKELSFSKLDSSFKVATAGNRGAGRSVTAQLLHGCLAKGTKIIDGLTSRLIDISDVKVGQSVITHNNNIAKVSFVSTQTKECYSVKVNGVNNYDLLSSGEHKFFTRDGWMELSSISLGDEIGYPVAVITDEIQELEFSIPRCIRKQGGGCVEKVPDKIKLNFNIGRLVGLYLAEGIVKYQHKYPDNPSAVQFAVHENEVDRTVEWLNSCGDLYNSVTVNRRKQSKTCIVSANGKSIGVFINSLVCRVDEKILPKDWRRMGKDFVRGMVIGYFAGDGHGDQQSLRVSATSTRESISIGMRDALASLGYGWATISRKEAAVRYGRNEQEAHILRLSGIGAKKLSDEIGKSCNSATRIYKQKYFKIEDGYCWTKIKSIEPVGLMEVYDLEVDHEDHSYCLLHGATHNSEVAYWPSAEDHLAGIMQTIPLGENTEIIFESTANGIGNVFHNIWNSKDWLQIFVPWFWQQEYRVSGVDLNDEDFEYGELFGLDSEQMQWRRKKIGELGNDLKLFMREYPSSPAEAFSVSDEKSLISSVFVQKARKAVADNDNSAPKIIGVDPARFGDDSTVLYIRQGRIAERIGKVNGKNTMEVVGMIVRAIARYSPEAVYVDVGGIGAGIYDRLKEMNYRMVRDVNFGSEPLDKKKYINKRAEMWGLMNEWLSSPPAQIPDNDDIEIDLCGLRYAYDSHGRLKIESKEDAKKRGIKSPDDGDALALTFAYPVRPKHIESSRIVTFGVTVPGMGG